MTIPTTPTICFTVTITVTIPVTTTTPITIAITIARTITMTVQIPLALLQCASSHDDTSCSARSLRLDDCRPSTSGQQIVMRSVLPQGSIDICKCCKTPRAPLLPIASTKALLCSTAHRSLRRVANGHVRKHALAERVRTHSVHDLPELVAGLSAEGGVTCEDYDAGSSTRPETREEKIFRRISPACRINLG